MHQASIVVKSFDVGAFLETPKINILNLHENSSVSKVPIHMGVRNNIYSFGTLSFMGSLKSLIHVVVFEWVINAYTSDPTLDLTL